MSQQRKIQRQIAREKMQKQEFSRINKKVLSDEYGNKKSYFALNWRKWLGEEKE